MGVIGEKWRCPICNVDVGGSMGEFKNHVKRVHSTVKSEMKAAAA
jgi:Sec-independent protein translocase protein TatA